jgi:amidohydrolase
MDGLPIADATVSAYRSQHDGLSHSCGHDVNMACVLAAAKLLAAQGGLESGVRIIMQPASEEVSDEEGKTGTYRMIEDRALDGLKSIIALHVDATMPPGMVGIINEPARIASGNFKIELKAASPDNSAFDAVAGASSLLNTIYAAARNSAEDGTSAIINGIETARGESEMLCRQVTLRGMLRATNKEARREDACQAARAHGANCNLEYLDDNAAGQVDAGLCELVRQVAVELLGDANVRVVKRQTWTEDFSALLKVTPGSMLLLGGQIQSSKRSHHSGAFDVDESALYIGAAVLAAAACRLGQESV